MKKALSFLLGMMLCLAVCAQPGSPDLNFNGTGKVFTSFFYDFGNGPEVMGQDYGLNMAIQPDGKIVLVGYSYNGVNEDIALIRLHPNGTRDNTFGTNGQAGCHLGANERGKAVVIQPDGKIVVAALAAGRPTISDFAVVRFNANGFVDSAFGTHGVTFIDFESNSDEPTCIGLQSDGKIVVAGFAVVPGASNDFAVARLTTTGSPDNSFDTDGKLTTFFGTQDDYLYALAIQDDDKILVAGKSVVAFVDAYTVVRYNTDGSLDNSFSGDGKERTEVSVSTEEARGIAIQEDGKIVVGGYGYVAINNDFIAVRYNTDGTPDNSFSGDGIATASIVSGIDFGMGVAIQSDGKVVMAGYSQNGSLYDFSLVRFNADGTLDTGFDGDGKVLLDIAGDDLGYAVAIDGNRIYAAGRTLDFNEGYYKFAVAAFHASSNLPLTLSGFTAGIQSGAVVLQWKTSSEQNTAKFIIERSYDGINFTQLSVVAAAGNSVSIKHYAFTDKLPLPVTGFYRLKMVDADDRFTYSGIVAVNPKITKQLVVFPNPVRNTLHIQANGEGQASLMVLDVAGRMLKKESLVLNGTAAFSINVQTLPKGQYYLVLQTAREKVTQQFMKE